MPRHSAAPGPGPRRVPSQPRVGALMVSPWGAEPLEADAQRQTHSLPRQGPGDTISNAINWLCAPMPSRAGKMGCFGGEPFNPECCTRSLGWACWVPSARWTLVALDTLWGAMQGL